MCQCWLSQLAEGLSARKECKRADAHLIVVAGQGPDARLLGDAPQLDGLVLAAARDAVAVGGYV